MIDDEKDPRMARAVADLQDRLDRLVAAGLDLTGAGLDEIRDIERDARWYWRTRGVALPRLTVLPLVRHRRVKLFRRDLTDKAISDVALGLTREFPDITMDEVVWGVRIAWPEYRQL